MFSGVRMKKRFKTLSLEKINFYQKHIKKIDNSIEDIAYNKFSTRERIFKQLREGR